MAGNIKAGIAYYQEAIAVCSSYAPAYYNIGVIYSENREVGHWQDLPNCRSVILGKLVLETSRLPASCLRRVGQRLGRRLHSISISIPIVCSRSMPRVVHATQVPDRVAACGSPNVSWRSDLSGVHPLM